MNKLFIAITIILLTNNSVIAEDKTNEFICNVTSVHDGDTFRCSDDIRVRVWGDRYTRNTTSGRGSRTRRY